jgi:hypothetical protein
MQLALSAATMMFALLVGPPGLADTLITKGGAHWEGKITEDADAYILVTAGGAKMRFPKSMVQEVITLEMRRTALRARCEKLDLMDATAVAELVKAAKEAEQGNELLALLESAGALRRLQPGAQVQALRLLAEACKAGDLDEQARQSEALAGRLTFTFERMKVDLMSDAQVEALLKIAEAYMPAEERARVVADAYAARLPAAKGKPDALRNLAGWCRSHRLSKEARECEADANRLEFDTRWAKAADSSQELESLAEWCAARRMSTEVDRCLESVYRARQVQAVTPQAKLDLALWCERWKKTQWRNEKLDEAFREAVVADDLGLLEQFRTRAQLRWGKDLTTIDEKCIKAIFAVRLKQAGKDGLACARLAEWCWNNNLDAEALEAENAALAVAPENAEVRKVLGYNKEAQTGRWIKLSFDGWWYAPTRQNESFQFHVVAGRSVEFFEITSRTVLADAALQPKLVILGVTDSHDEQTFNPPRPIVAWKLPTLAGSFSVKKTDWYGRGQAPSSAGPDEYNVEGRFTSAYTAVGTLTIGNDIIPWIALRQPGRKHPSDVGNRDPQGKGGTSR